MPRTASAGVAAGEVGYTPGRGMDLERRPKMRTLDNLAVALAGAQLPFGGYKGASIALMVELLAAALVGDLFSFEASEADPGDGGPPRGGGVRGGDGVESGPARVRGLDGDTRRFRPTSAAA